MGKTCHLLIVMTFLMYCRTLLAQQYTQGDYILVLHSINFNETWTHQSYETIRTTFTQRGLIVKGEELQVPAIRDTTEIINKLDDLRKHYAVPPKAVVCIGDPAWLIVRPLFDKEWKEVPSLIWQSISTNHPHFLRNIRSRSSAGSSSFSC